MPSTELPPPAFTKREMFDYVLGALENGRARELERQIKLDAELAGKVAFFSSMFRARLSDEETGSGLVDS
jgi:anti-sigma-K factor RskA